MTKKNTLLAAIALFSICALYAFAYPEAVRENVLTLFLPEGVRPVASNRYLPLSAEHEVKAVKQQASSLDTLPPLSERYDDFINSGGSNPVDLRDPKAIDKQVEYDATSNRYIITERIGDDFYRAPTYMTFEEYVRWRDEQQQREYFDRLQGVVSSDGKNADGTTDPVSKFNFKNTLIDRLFGGTNVDIKPQGNINLTFGYDWQKIQNPILTLRQQTNGNFDFDMDINMSAQGKIGEKLNLNFNYNTQATFDFDNQMKINYDTKGFSEDEIIQNVEAGNVSMPLRSNLIKGAQNLFGIKTEMKFGHLRTTLVASQQRSKQQSLKIQGGSQVQNFEKPIDEYDENRHFFVSHWNRNQFEPAMKCLPVPQSLFNITRMEVWITNDKQDFVNTRDVLPITELAEPDSVSSDWKLASPPGRDINGNGLPANQNNKLYSRILSELSMDSTLRFSDRVVSRLTSSSFNLKQIRDFEKMNARLLSPQEFSYHDQLGFISVNLNVQPDQVVGVALSYTYNGVPYKIGEFSDEVPKKSSEDTLKTNVLFLKMLKSTTANVRYPIWDLMMKNVYAVGTANVDPQEFRFDIYYEDPGRGQKRFLDGPLIPNGLKSRPLLQVFNLDNLNLQGDPGPDGIFDFVPGITINLRSGRIMFPVLEPFGSDLFNKIKQSKIAGGELFTAQDSLNLKKDLIYQQLYDSTTFVAREYQQLNRFMLRGTYKSSVSSEISLGTFNLPPGSVRVTAGGAVLREGVQYSIDYNIGKIRILDDAILQSGQSVNVSFEDNTFFGFQSRSMIGARFDYAFNKDLSVGATFMNLFERPLTQKVNFGDDPINNKVYGLDFSISKDAPWLTKLIDKLPLIQTKEPSSISAQAEVAVLQPGHNRAINQGGDKGGTVYLDDFEGSTANIPLTFQFNQWVIASVPRDDDDWAPQNKLFPESDPSNTSLSLGANRAGLSWYISDPSARDANDGTDPYTRLIQYQDIFPNRQLTPFEQSSLRPLDVTIYPRERGPYNFDVPIPGYPGYSKGLTTTGKLEEPKTRWAGFMKEVTTNDFEASNIEFIEFWMLNPYMEKSDGEAVSDAGQMYIDLGSISEDVMRDSRQFFENGLPTGTNNVTTDVSPWGRVPIEAPIVNAFDNNEASRREQDIGLDGLDSLQETSFGEIGAWFQQIQNDATLSPNFKNEVRQDPSNDNFVYFRDNSFPQAPAGPGLLNRYRKFNNQEGNSPVNQSQDQNPSSTNYPDQEDLNRDRSLNETEAYFRYKIDLKKTTVNGVEVIDENDPALAEYITNTVTFTKENREYTWYRFKIPLDDVKRQSAGGIEDFRSIRFIRMFWKGFDERTTFRFATLELGRNQWRRFRQNLEGCGFDGAGIPPPIPFDVNAVNIEENSARQPFNYTIPFGIQREQSVGAFPDILQNEQSLAMNICSLRYCDARAVFKSLNMDLRQYNRLKMFVHAEKTQEELKTGDLSVFIRMGSDYTRNYYEYELPLVVSDPTNLNGNPDSRDYKEEVWRSENIFDFPLNLLTEVKKQRNADITNNPLVPFISVDPNRPEAQVKIFGNPNLGYVKGIMIGVRNTDTTKQEHCVEVWLNELRLNGFNEKGGFAGLARVDMKLADLGGISLSTNYTGIGWGSIEEKLAQRQREEVLQFDVSTNIELGKLLPEKTGVKVPFYAQYSNVTRTPEYDPYDLDIKLKDKLRETANAADRDSIRFNAKDVTVVKGYNFTNVRKERRGKPRKIPLPWNIENFSVTYAYNEQEKRTPFILSDNQKQRKGGLDWQYGTGIKPITPFKKLIKKDKYLKFITEFNFNPLPNTFGFNTNLERFEGVTTYRFAGEDAALNTYYNRRFTWERNYDLGWDISKAIRFNFDANAKSLIDEPQEYVSEGGPRVTRQERRDSIWTNLKNLGRPKNYTHNASINWTLPFKQIPMLDFISMKASYTGGYTWTAQSLKLQNLEDPAAPFSAFENSRDLGNTIQNNNTRQINGDFSMETLYNKSKYLAKINKPGKPGSGSNRGGNNGNRPGNRGARGSDDGGMNPTPDRGGTRPPSGTKPSGGGKDDGAPSGGEKGNNPAPDRNDPSTPPAPPDAAPGSMGSPGAPLPGGPGGIDPVTGRPLRTRPNPGGSDPSNPADPDGGGKGKKDGNDKKDKNKVDRQPTLAERIALRPLMLVRKARFTYSETRNNVIPGFTPETKLLGLSEGFDSPGWAFVSGYQEADRAYLDHLGATGSITQRPELNQQVMKNYTQNLDLGLTVEPFTDFRIELNANKQYTRNSTELFKDQIFNIDPNPDSVRYEHRAARDLGSYTISFLSLNTMFNKDIAGLFARYESYRPLISERLVTENGLSPDSLHSIDDGYKKGYGRIHQEVLIPAFLAAYTKKDPKTVGLDIFKTMPAPNWKLTYNGLSKLGNLKDIFSSIQISHGYKNTLTVSSYNTDIFYEQSLNSGPGGQRGLDSLNFNYSARFEIPQVVINEQFQPLFGIDVKLKNEMTFKADMKRTRTLSMSFIDYQLSETKSSGYTIGFGYRIKDVNIPFLTGKKSLNGKSKKKSKSKKKKPATPPTPPPGGGSSSSANDLTFKFDFEVRDDITIAHILDSPNEAQPTRGARTISINPQVEYALNKRLKLRLFADYRKTVPKTSQSFPITTLNTGVTVQFTLN
ncbi:MAG: cell surface protein SprA [Saprospiraceae bacterium]